MSEELESANRRFLAVQQDDGNFVVYRRDTMRSVWDAWSFGGGVQPPAPQPGPPPLLPTTGTSFSEIRVTDERDGELLNRGYSYWSQAWVSGDLVHLFVGHADLHPRFFSVHLRTGEFHRLGPLLQYTGTGEGLYWDAQGRICFCDGPRLLRVNPFTHEQTVLMDIGAMMPGHDLWQAHSSDDGRTHSATVRQVVESGPYPKVGTIASYRGPVLLYPAQGMLDESQVDASGQFLIVKEDDDNRIVTLATGEQRILHNAEGALGHSDCGPGYMVGEDDQIGACMWVDLASFAAHPLFSTWNMGHVSVRGQRWLLSGPQCLSMIPPGGGKPVPLLDHGMTGSGYDFQVHGNLSPCGRVAMWMSNKAGRMDAYIGELP